MTTFAGIDVGAKQLFVCAELNGKDAVIATFDNDSKGHKALIQYLSKKGRKAKVCMEATGSYHFNLAVALHAAKNIEVSVVNPRAMKHYAEAVLQRAKTDKVDSRTILDYLKRMDFVVWEPPAPEYLELRALARRMSQLSEQAAREKNRRHAEEFKNCLSDAIQCSIDESISSIEKIKTQVQEIATTLIKNNAVLEEKYQILLSVKGIGPTSAIQILAEIMCLPEDMNAEQWVAYAGLDPKAVESGSSVKKPRRISKYGNKYLRTALFMPALVAKQHDPNVQAFYGKLVAAGKLKMQAIVAVMRKLLRCIWGMLYSKTPWNGELFYSGDCNK